MNEQIEQLEYQLEEMPLVKRLGIYIVIFISILYLSWNFFVQDMALEIESAEENIVSLEKKLQKNSIKSIKRAIKKTKDESLVLEDDNTNLHFKNQFIRSKLESIGFIYYGSMGAAQILDDILKNSLKDRIDIKFITSKKRDEPYIEHINEKEQIHVSGLGSFKSIMKLLYNIDNLNALLGIREIVISIDEDDNTNFDLNISHYGVEL